MLKVKLVRSKIDCTPNQRRTLEALGLRRIRHEREVPDTPSFKGMIKKVEHLVEVTEI